MSTKAVAQGCTGGNLVTGDMNVAIRVPSDLEERDQWVLWRLERMAKVPYRPDGRRASTTEPSDWSEYPKILHVFESQLKYWSGIGFVFTTEDPFVGIDLDDCLDECGTPKESTRGIIERFADTYMEISPSGHGLKIWAKGQLPAAVGKVAFQDGAAIEMYDRKRYFAVTGKVFRGAPLQVEDHAQDILRLYERLTRANGNHPQGPKYRIPPEVKIPKGMQHLTLVAIAGALRRYGVCDRAIDACLQAVNRNQCSQPGLSENISRIVTSSRPWSKR